jgi:hypothetical protein
MGGLGIPRRVTALLVAIASTGCSVFGSNTQMVTISSEPEGARVTVNGQRAGETPLRMRVSRSEDLLVEVRKAGYETAFRSSHRTLSGLGIADVVGGSVWLVPLFGLLSSAAWEHDPSTFAFLLEPQDGQGE